MTDPRTSIIVVEQELGIARRLERLVGPDCSVSRVASIDHVLDRFESEHYDVLLVTSTAFKHGQTAGVELLEVIVAKSPRTQIIVLATPEDTDIAMAAVRAGSYQYARLPIDDEELKLLVEIALEQQPQYGDNLFLSPTVQETRLGPILGRSEPMQELYRQIRQASATDIPALILGETGTGKDLVAQVIHELSDRKDGPYVTVHLGALPGELVAGELFGHERGAFTGAMESREGKFEQADGGTIFLDEIGTIDERVQVSLLRLIEQKKFSRLGGRKTLTTDCRILAATNENLVEAVSQSNFREDLYYRLDVFHIEVPALRERTGDVPLLVDEFLRKYKDNLQKNILGIEPECIRLLETYDWPGNVRELKNVIQRAVLICDGETIVPEHLPPRFRTDDDAKPMVSFEVGTPLAEVEREMVNQTVSRAKSRSEAADLLGISRRALYNKLKKYNLQ